MKVPGGLVMQLLGVGGDGQSKQLYKKILQNNKYIYICQFFVEQFKEYPVWPEFSIPLCQHMGQKDQDGYYAAECNFFFNFRA